MVDGEFVQVGEGGRVKYGRKSFERKTGKDLGWRED
jgi:hypothetical protein